VELVETQIANDGKILTADNYKIEWSDNKAIIILLGEEQENEKHEILFEESDISLK